VIKVSWGGINGKYNHFFKIWTTYSFIT
jgi:hypothetical protein